MNLTHRGPGYTGCEMMMSKTILISSMGPVATITLNRPEVHHAMNPEMIRELNLAFSEIAEKPDIRLILFGSSGSHFCAGADLNWMKQGIEQNEEELIKEGLELGRLFKLMTEVPQIIVTTLKGKVMGGANGLVAASDLVIAESNTSFSFSEVKLGLVPATIAPFIMNRVGRSRASVWMITGRSFGAKEAVSAGLAHFSFEEGELETERMKLVEELLSGGPEAMTGIKKMLLWLESDRNPKEVAEKCAAILAKFRVSDQGQKGMKAFLEKRRPDWNEK
jgi:methylglutaconyl-CoA hydratase